VGVVVATVLINGAGRRHRVEAFAPPDKIAMGIPAVVIRP
jgi:hypothetical protein